LDGVKKELALKAAQLFKEIDEFKLGYISSSILCKWTSENCGYKINEEEVTLILSRYDRDGDYRISKSEFLKEVLP